MCIKFILIKMAKKHEEKVSVTKTLQLSKGSRGDVAHSYDQKLRIPVRNLIIQ